MNKSAINKRIVNKNIMNKRILITGAAGTSAINWAIVWLIITM